MVANYTYFSENRLQYRLSWRRCVVTRRFLGVLLPALAVLFFLVLYSLHSRYVSRITCSGCALHWKDRASMRETWPPL